MSDQETETSYNFLDIGYALHIGLISGIAECWFWGSGRKHALLNRFVILMNKSLGLGLHGETRIYSFTEADQLGQVRGPPGHI